MTEAVSSQQWRITTSMFIEGCAYGSQYPSLIFNVEGTGLTEDQRQDLLQWFDTILPPEREDWRVDSVKSGDDDWQETLLCLLRIIQRLQHATAQAVFEQGSIQSMGSNSARCLVPTRPRAAVVLIRTIQLLLRCLDTWVNDQRESRGELADQLQKALDELERQNVQGNNVPSLVKAATGLKIPFRELSNFFQYGMGKRSRWLESSHTGFTSHLGVRLARNKLTAVDMLQRSGLPVPQHNMVRSAEEAMKVADTLGYPVVVKPIDRDAGIGVGADLRNAEEVSQAFEAARKHSPNIMVEKHVEGRDYRLLVFQGEMIWAIERVPGGVTGDGQHSVAELVEQLKDNPGRSGARHSPLKLLHLDAEAELMLQRQQMDAASVPENGQFVRLRRAANIASGGRPVPVTDRVHPDNRLLAERAAQACRLDIAGIDLLISDISRSWWEAGAAIIEVNSQPNMGQTTTRHLYAPMLNRLVPGNGRVPVVAVMGAPAESNLVEVLAKAISSRMQMVVGYHDAKVVSVNNRALKAGPVTTSDAAEMLMMTPTVDAMVLTINDLSILQTGLPFPYFDILVIAGDHTDLGAHADRQQALPALMRALVSSCDGKIVTLKEAGLQITPPAGLAGVEWVEEPVPAEQLINTLVTAVSEAEQRHGKEPALEQDLTHST